MQFDPIDARSFLVPIDGTEAAYGALAVACQTASKTKASVTAIYVIEVARALPLNANLTTEEQHGEEMLEQADTLAAVHNVSLQSELFQARQTGHVIVDEAIDRGVGAIVIGVPYRRPFGRFELGPIAEYVLEHAPGYVWLVRYPDKDEQESASLSN